MICKFQYKSMIFARACNSFIGSGFWRKISACSSSSKNYVITCGCCDKKHIRGLITFGFVPSHSWLYSSNNFLTWAQVSYPLSMGILTSSIRSATGWTAFVLIWSSIWNSSCLKWSTVSWPWEKIVSLSAIPIYLNCILSSSWLMNWSSAYTILPYDFKPLRSPSASNSER